MLSALFYFGWVFIVQGLPPRWQPLGGFGVGCDLHRSRVHFGGLAGHLVQAARTRRTGAAVYLLAHGFLSGFSWPFEALPEVLQALRWLIPSTAGSSRRHCT